MSSTGERKGTYLKFFQDIKVPFLRVLLKILDYISQPSLWDNKITNEHAVRYENIKDIDFCFENPNRKKIVVHTSVFLIALYAMSIYGIKIFHEKYKLNVCKTHLQD